MCRARVSAASRRAHRAASGRRRAPGDLPGVGGRGRRRRGRAAVRGAGVPEIPDVRRVRAWRGAVSVRGLRARAPGALLLQRAGVVSQCGGRRMTERAAHLVDAVLPWVPVRQWVLTVPYRLRYQMAWNHGLSRAVLRVYTRVLLDVYTRGARACGVPGG